MSAEPACPQAAAARPRDAALMARVAALVERAPLAAYGAASPARVLADRPDGTVVRYGPLVCKVHAADGDPVELAARLRVAAHPSLRTVLLAPLPVPPAPHPPPGPRAAPPATPPHRPHPGASPLGAPRTPVPPAATEPPEVRAALAPLAGPRFLAPMGGGREASLWPYGAPVSSTERQAAPWEALGGLLARLHRVPVRALPGPVPAMRGPVKVAAALERLRAAPDAVATSPAARAVREAAGTLPDWARGAAPAPVADHLCHGDLHLGQLVRREPTGPLAVGAPAEGWLLIDVDDLGLGDPAWDLARPAAWFATGLLDPSEWTRLLTAYRAAGGPATGEGDDPWPWLDAPARALTVQSAALGLAKAATASRPLDFTEEAMVAACARMLGEDTAPVTGLPATTPT
ncbi:phosphotransferase family protein [Streptomyces sp. NPDC057702]|uniref:phosphotransferase family protein n=1 Tax=unclassified Streptomyces TaxID=2593676 RepID=UPI0036AD1664